MEPCYGCEERRKLMFEQVAALNAAARAKMQTFLADMAARRDRIVGKSPDPAAHEHQQP